MVRWCKLPKTINELIDRLNYFKSCLGCKHYHKCKRVHTKCEQFTPRPRRYYILLTFTANNEEDLKTIINQTFKDLSHIKDMYVVSEPVELEKYDTPAEKWALLDLNTNLIFLASTCKKYLAKVRALYLDEEKPENSFLRIIRGSEEGGSAVDYKIIKYKKLNGRILPKPDEADGVTVVKVDERRENIELWSWSREDNKTHYIKARQIGWEGWSRRPWFI